jgi:hypothetical protein
MKLTNFRDQVQSATNLEAIGMHFKLFFRFALRRTQKIQLLPLAPPVPRGGRGIISDLLALPVSGAHGGRQFHTIATVRYLKYETVEG